MGDEEYTILPHKEIQDLKEELDKLKKNPDLVDNSLKASIGNLNDSLGALMGVFKEATQEMRLEEGEESILNKKFVPLMEKMDLILEQNQKIAEGIVALADILKGMPERVQRSVHKDLKDVREPERDSRDPWQQERSERSQVPQMPSQMPPQMPPQMSQSSQPPYPPWGNSQYPYPPQGQPSFQEFPEANEPNPYADFPQQQFGGQPMNQPQNLPPPPPVDKKRSFFGF
jgi:hypothetical protein